MKSRFLSRNWLSLMFFGLMTVALWTGLLPQADSIAFAQVEGSDGLLGPGDRPGATVETPFRDAVRQFVNYFLSFLGLIAVVFVIYAGVLMVTSGGDEEKTNKGKKILLWAGAGILIILLSYAIVRLFVGAGDAVA